MEAEEGKLLQPVDKIGTQYLQPKEAIKRRSQAVEKGGNLPTQFRTALHSPLEQSIPPRQEPFAQRSGS